ncbi:MAG: phage baseplate assembly protein V [Armatimonadota bacterium]
MLEFENEEHADRYAGKWYGKYRAFVRDNHDPERLGRCRLEIPSVLGVGKDNWSDWAAPCFPYGGTDNVGMFLVPEEGASVWAEFEGGEPQHPIWSGMWLAMSNPGEMPDEAKRLCNVVTCASCPDRDDHASSRADNLEHRKYHNHPPYYCTKMKVLAKTTLGHAILLDDKDNTACIRIIDSSGQEILLESGRSVRITDISGSTITMDAQSGDITISSSGKVHINP